MSEKDIAISDASPVASVATGLQSTAALQVETAATALAAAAKATIEARYVLAMRKPRDFDLVRAMLLKECARPRFAEDALYRKPQGRRYNDATQTWEDNYVEGFSVRFTETAKRCMTNVYWSAILVFDDSSKAIIRVTVMDLESNDTGETDVVIEKTVERQQLRQGQIALRVRTNSYGKTVYLVAATDDEILNKTNAAISKAFRNLVLRMLPADIAADCEDRCRAVRSAAAAADPEAARKKLFDAFASVGVMPDQLKAYLGHANALTPAELTELRGIFSAIRDGETTWSAVRASREPAASEPTEKTAAAKAVDEILKKASEKRGKRPAQPQPPHDPETGEVREPGEEG